MCIFQIFGWTAPAAGKMIRIRSNLHEDFLKCWYSNLCFFRYFGPEWSGVCEQQWQYAWTLLSKTLCWYLHLCIFQMFGYNMAMVSKWSGAREKSRYKISFNLSMCSWEWVGVCWQWLDPSHKGSWRVICKLLHWLNCTMLSRTKISANWRQIGVINDTLLLHALLGKSFTWSS